MSGGVDSSVTALLAKNVCQKKLKHISKTSIKLIANRILIFLLYLCGTWILEMNLALARDANGKTIGKMFN